MIASRRELLWALGLFIVLALVLGWPLPTRFTREIPVGSTPVNAMHLLYALTWSAQTLGDNPFHLFNATFFYPIHIPIAFIDHMVGLATLVAPINWATGSMAGGFNAAWLLTFVLSGLGTYLLVRYLGGSILGGILAGVLYTAFPLRLESAGQINLLAMMWIPFALMSLHLWVETRLRRELFLFLAFALLQFLSSAYSGIFLVVAVLTYAAVLLLVERTEALDLFRRQWWVILTVFLLGLIATAPFVIPYLWATRSEGELQRSLMDTAAYSAVPLDLITPGAGTLLHGLAPWGAAATHPAFPGVIAFALLVYWVARRGWRRDPIHHGELLFYLTLVPVSALLALGPLLGGEGGRIPLPFHIAYYLLPGGSFVREPVRFLLLGSLAVAVLAGLGLSLLLERRSLPRAARWAAVALPILAFVELYPGPPKLMNPLPGGIPAVYSWLGSVEGELAVLELPMPPDQHAETVAYARYQLYSLVHHKRLVNGVASNVPRITQEIRRQMQHFPDNGSVRRLQEIGVNYVLVHSNDYPPAERADLAERIRAANGIHVVDMSGPIWILDVVPMNPTRGGRS